MTWAPLYMRSFNVSYTVKKMRDQNMRKRYKIIIFRTVAAILFAVLAVLIAARRNNGFAMPGAENIRTSEMVSGEYDEGGSAGGSAIIKSSEADSRGVVEENDNGYIMNGTGSAEDSSYAVSALKLSDYEKLSIDPLSPRIYEGAALKKRMKELAALDKTYKKINKRFEDYPENVLAAFCNEPGMSDFVLGYNDEDRVCNAAYTKDELEAEFPLLLQWDKRWGYESYGDSCIGLAGCAPVCLAMVSLFVNGESGVTPDQAASYAMERGYYLRGTGTSWSFMTEGAGYVGLYGRELGLSESAVMSELKAGHPVICSVRPGIFTARGHFIVLAGLQDGKIIVRDPNSAYRSSLLWDFTDIKGQIKNMWSYTKPSQSHTVRQDSRDVQYDVIFDIRDY